MPRCPDDPMPRSSSFSPSIRGEWLQAHVLTGAAGALVAEGVAVGGVIHLAYGGMAAGFKNMLPSGCGQRRSEIRIASYEAYAVSKVADIIVAEPQAALAVRTAIAVARHIGGQ